MEPETKTKKQQAGLFFGLAAGLAFAIFAWGMDGYLLTRSHGAYAWVNFLIGLPLCLLAGGLVGWLSMLYKKTSLIVLSWLGLGILFSRLIFWLPLRVKPSLVLWLNEPLGDYLKYSNLREINELVWLGSIVVLFISVGCGLIEEGQVNEYVYSGKHRDLLVTLFICMTLFSLAGALSDTLINRKFRQPIQALDQLVQFALDNMDKEVPSEVAESMNLDVVNGFRDYLPQKRSMIPSFFNPSMNQVEILLTFSGMWAKCSTFYNRITSCEPAIKMPWILRSDFSGNRLWW